MKIVYACDDRYAMIAGISIASLYEQHREVDDLSVYILICNVTNESIRKLSAVAERHGRCIHFMDTTLLMDAFLPDSPLRTGQWSAAAYARLYAAELLPQIDKIMYLDCDVLISGSLLPLWEMDLSEYGCAAVTEPFSAMHKQNIGVKAEDNYFNSGVMLIHLNHWRKVHAKERFFECIARHNGRVPYVDQGVLNEVFCGQIVILPAKYNVFTEFYDFSYGEIERYRAARFAYSKEEIQKAKEEPAVIHFTGSFLTARPWCEGSGHPYAAKWLWYKDRSPWKDAPLWKNKRSFEKEALGWIFKRMPRLFGIEIARMANSMVRPLIDIGINWLLRQKTAVDRKQSMMERGAPS